MTGPVTKVTEVRGAYAFEGTTYGPFQASKDKPFLEVPAQLATALGLPLHESEVQAREAAAAQDEDGGVDVQVILRANEDLKADVEAMTQDRDRVQQELGQATQRAGEWERHANEAGAKVTTLTAELEAARTRITELEEQLASAIVPAGTDAEKEAGPTSTALPDDFPHRDLLTEAGFTTVEAVRTGLQKTAGQEKSAVENISGIGPAALKKITEASR